MKYYVVTVTEDDGWQADHRTIGVKTSFRDAVDLMIAEENKFQSRHDYKNEPEIFKLKRTPNYVFYDCNGDWWWKVEYEEVEENENV